MESETLGLLSVFRRELEALNARLHVASSLAEVAGILASIARERNVQLAVKTSMPFDVEIGLIEELLKYGIKVVDVEKDEWEIVSTALAKADMGISSADLAIAETGTLILVTRRDEDRLVTALPRVHVAIVPSDRLVRSLDEAVPLLRAALGGMEPCAVSFISGPSRSGDIEMRLVLGVHGPHEVHVIVFGG